MYTNAKEKRYDIGGVFDLVLTEADNGFVGEYKRKGSSQVFMFDGAGMSKKKILTMFWNKVKKCS